jgi:apolipoprotein D and lipocalin family protein
MIAPGAKCGAMRPYFIINRSERDVSSMKKLWMVLAALVTGCTGIPENVRPVENFQLSRYLGRWHEIARLDHSFERGLNQVTADYSLREDGGVRVINRGYSLEKGEWKAAEGRAYFVQGADRGHLRVSFFGPFYGSYIIFELDHDHYRYALVCGPNTSYFWILAREPVLDKETLDLLLTRAAEAGFDTSKLIFN